MDSRQPEINYAFIDAQNLNLGVISKGWKIDYRKFRLYLKNKYKVAKAVIFIGYLEKNLLLYRNLRNSGFELIFKPVSIAMHSGRKVVKGNVDAELVLHAMIEIQNYNKAVIVSGDGDFHCLVEHLAKIGKLEKILVPNKRYSHLYKKFTRRGMVDNISDAKKSLESHKK